jgi:hypothetical protein
MITCFRVEPILYLQEGFWRFVAGNGCFNDRTRKLAAARSEVAIICCCTCGCACSLHSRARNATTRTTLLANAGLPSMMVPTAISTFPDGIMNVHDAT